MGRMVVWAVLVGAWLVAPARANDSLDEELREVTEALRERPSDVRLLRDRVELWLLAEQPEHALRDLDVLDALSSAPTSTRLLRAEALFALGGLEAALAVLDAEIAQAPDDAAAHELRARVATRLGRLELAEQDWTAAWYAAPTIVRAVGRADALRALHRVHDEARACREALSTLGEAGLVRWRLVDALERAGDFDQALVALDAAPRLSPVRRGLSRARLLTALGRTGEAAIELARTFAFAQARAARRPSLAAHREEAHAALAAGRRDEAHAAARRALVIAPNDPSMRALLGGAR